MVARTVTRYVRAGVAGMHIEDQVQTKRCGHLLGKQVVSREEFLTRIRAAVIARDSIPGGSDFVIIGRTDSAQVLGMEEAVLRLKLAADAGADVCFIEGVKTSELLETTVAALAPKPVLVNVISGGLTPSFTCKEAEDMGAKIISKWLLRFALLFPNLFVQSFHWYRVWPLCTVSGRRCTRSRRQGRTFRLPPAWSKFWPFDSLDAVLIIVRLVPRPSSRSWA